MAHQIDESKPKYLSQTRFMSGRRIIKTSVTEITDENVVDVLRKALATHELNRSEIDYLWKYYRGDQPIRNRVKDVRPEICNKITENRANEIVSFKVGYLCGEPIQYVSRNGGEEIVKQINTLNEYMFAEDKAAQDQELVEWQMICGTAFRLVLPDEPGEEDEGVIPDEPFRFCQNRCGVYKEVRPDVRNRGRVTYHRSSGVGKWLRHFRAGCKRS